MTSRRPASVRLWSSIGTRFLPFADAATKELPLPRLLRLSLFQVSVGLAMVLMMRFRPRGFVTRRQPTVFLKERKAVSSDLVKEGHG